MRATLMNGTNAGKTYSLNWDNRTGTPIGGGSASSIVALFAGCSYVSFSLGTVVGSFAGGADDIINALEALHRGALVPA